MKKGEKTKVREKERHEKRTILSIKQKSNFFYCISGEKKIPGPSILIHNLCRWAVKC